MEGDDRTFRVDFSSEGVSRLREAVKEKLKEFMGDYTDDTLVEYVIVLLKNGRRKDEARSELNVFLGDDDSDTFVSWLWDHLGSNIGLYVQPPELHTDGAPKTKLTGEDQGGKTVSHQNESEAKKGNSNKSFGHNHNRERTGLVRDGDENEVPIPHNAVADNVNSQDEPRRRTGRTKPSLSPRPTIHKKRRRTEEQQRRKREASQPTVSAPRRLLQFAVRDAVGTSTSRTSNSTAEPSVKRLRSVVSTSTGDSPLEERPVRIHRPSMSAAMKAMAEAVRDVSKIRPPRNVFDRLGHATDVSNTTNLQEYGGVAEDMNAGDFSVEVENFDSIYHPQYDSSRLQVGNMSSFHDTVMDSDLGYDGENFYGDFDVRGREATDISRSGTSVGNWVDSNPMFEYGSADNVDERLHRPYRHLDQPAMVHNTSLRIASSVRVNSRRPFQYQEERIVPEMDSIKVMQDSDAVDTKSKVWMMKENSNPILAVNGNAKPDTISQQSEKTQSLTGPHNTGSPTEDADSRTIFVSNVHFGATKDSLSRHFNKFGEVLKVIILTDPTTGQPKGSAYIEFMRKDAAELALSLDGTSFMSRILKIVRKSSAQPEATSAVTWPRVARASPFAVPRFSRPPFARGGLYRGRGLMKPGSRSLQWKRESDSAAADVSGQASNTFVAQPTTRSLTYVRTESKTNGSSGNTA